MFEHIFHVLFGCLHLLKVSHRFHCTQCGDLVSINSLMIFKKKTRAVYIDNK